VEVAPCMKNGFFPQSSPTDRGEIREGEQVADTFSAACWATERQHKATRQIANVSGAIKKAYLGALI
jgi:hypothetical protein